MFDNAIVLFLCFIDTSFVERLEIGNASDERSKFHGANTRIMKKTTMAHRTLTPMLTCLRTPEQVAVAVISASYIGKHVKSEPV